MAYEIPIGRWKESEKWELVAQLCLTLCDPMNCSPPGSSVHWVFQARILEWVAIPFSRGSSQPRGQTQVSCPMGEFFTIWATREARLGLAQIWHVGERELVHGLTLRCIQTHLGRHVPYIDEISADYGNVSDRLHILSALLWYQYKCQCLWRNSPLGLQILGPGSQTNNWTMPGNSSWHYWGHTDLKCQGFALFPALSLWPVENQRTSPACGSSFQLRTQTGIPLSRTSGSSVRSQP